MWPSGVDGGVGGGDTPAMSDDVTITLDHDAVSASTVVDATPAAVFDFLRRPANHAADQR